MPLPVPLCNEKFPVTWRPPNHRIFSKRNNVGFAFSNWHLAYFFIPFVLYWRQYWALRLNSQNSKFKAFLAKWAHSINGLSFLSYYCLVAVEVAILLGSRRNVLSKETLPRRTFTICEWLRSFSWNNYTTILDSTFVHGLELWRKVVKAAIKCNFKANRIQR